MNRSDNDTRPDDDQHKTSGTVAGTLEGWVYHLLRRSFGRANRDGTRVVVTKSTAGTVKAVVACLGASATEAIGSYDWIRDLAGAMMR
jgi:hypothetical protein